MDSSSHIRSRKRTRSLAASLGSTSIATDSVIMESLVKKKQKGAILEFKRRHLKNSNFCTYTPYPAIKIRHISAAQHKKRIMINSRSGVSTTTNTLIMDDLNITMEEYIWLEKEKARRRGKVYNWETATYGKIWYDEDVHDLRSVETEFPAIVFDDPFTSEVMPSCKPTISPFNDNKIDFRVSFDESDDEDYTSNNPSFPSPELTVSYFDDLDFFKDLEKEFPAIVYNDALTSKSDFLIEHIVNPQHIDEFNLNDETSLSECDEKEQNVLYFNDLFLFNVIYPDDLKSDTDNDNDKIDIEQPLGDMYQYGVSWGPSEQNYNIGGVFINMEISKCWSLKIPRRLFNTLFAHELNLENHF
ncbi:hypothetical protein Tco_0625894 [Tanacetum coccineum]|uniref:Uncharacterized protein n=1 Tax=Tanacetum coccineum TaxID=301880 RepID=A0ABQ4WI18_9ASTR